MLTASSAIGSWTPPQRRYRVRLNISGPSGGPLEFARTHDDWSNSSYAGPALFEGPPRALGARAR
jgi:hypothetical protein